MKNAEPIDGWAEREHRSQTADTRVESAAARQQQRKEQHGDALERDSEAQPKHANNQSSDTWNRSESDEPPGHKATREAYQNVEVSMLTDEDDADRVQRNSEKHEVRGGACSPGRGEARAGPRSGPTPLRSRRSNEPDQRDPQVTADALKQEDDLDPGRRREKRGEEIRIAPAASTPGILQAARSAE